MKQRIVYVPEWDNYPRHGIFIHNGLGFEEQRIKPVTAIWWWFCKLRFWRYKRNDFGFLVKMNSYTRWSNKYLTEDWNKL